MNRNGAMMFIFTLGMSSLMTFVLGLLLGYALFSPRVQPVQQPNQQVAAQPPSEQTTTPDPTANPPATTPPVAAQTEGVRTASNPATTPAVGPAETGDDLHVARHLFIAVNGQWLADGTRALLQEIQPGGVILRASNVTSGVQVRSLVQEIKATSGGAHPYDWPLIAVSQEGGLGNTLRVEDAEPAVELGLANDKQRARQLGQLYGQTATDYGINVVLGPMLDVYDDTTAFPDLRTRSFGPDQTRVAALGLAMAEGMRAGGVIAVAKQFPGYASAGYSSDGISVVMHQDFDGLARALYPFSEAADSAIQGMVVGHVGVPLLDKDDPYRSAALSPVLVTELLRNRWQYSGVVLADDIAYNSMTRSRPVERAAVEALLAGCDAVIFLDPNPDAIRAVINAIERAVAVGELTVEQLKRSEGRLDKWRFALGGQPIQQPEPESAQVAMLQELAAGGTTTDEAPLVTEPEVPTIPSDVVLTTPAPSETPEETNPLPEETEVASAPPVTEMTDPAAESETEAPAVEEPATTEPEPESTPEEPEEMTVAANEETPDAPAPVAEVQEDLSKLLPMDYEVQEGETLLAIAWAYDLTPDDIIRWNGLESAEPEAGSTLKLYLPLPEGVTPPVAGTEEPSTVPATDEPNPDEAELEEKMIVALNAIDEEHQKELEAAAESTETPDAEAPAETQPESETETPAETAPESETETETAEPMPEPEVEVTEPEPAPVVEEPTAEAPAETPVPSEADAEEMTVAAADPEPASAEPTPEPALIEPEAEVPEEPASAETTPFKIVHQVQWGETLTSIATSYGVKVIDIRSWNGMGPDEALQANAMLLIYVDSEEKMTATQEPTPAPSENLKTYVVQTGDTMSKIARQHNTNVDEIVRLNTLKNPNAIFVGQKLKVPSI